MHLMFTLLLRALTPVALLAAATPTQLRIDGGPPVLRQLAAAVRADLPAPAPDNGEELAHHVLGRLRLAELDAARARLSDSGGTLLSGGGGDADVAWLCAAELWYLRATDDTTVAREHWPLLLRRVAALAPRSDDTFCSGMLRVNARMCCAEIANALLHDDTTEQGKNTAEQLHRRAVVELLELERRCWQPGRGHFRPRPTDGELALPAPAEDALLVPAAAGMLVASGDRLLRHLAGTLDAIRSGDARRYAAGGLTEQRAALQLSAATQLGDLRHRAACFADMLEAPAPTTAAGRALHLDAVAYAITGLRLATGAGVDTTWLRLSPWLPPDSDHLIADGMVARGARLRLELTRRRAQRGADATLAVCVWRTDGDAGIVLPVVVGAGEQQFLALLAPAESFACELPQ